MNENKVFESNRSGTVHRYEIKNDGLYYSAGTLTRLNYQWKEFKGLTEKRDTLFLALHKRQNLAVWLDDKQMKEFIPSFFQAWSKNDYGNACKAAFDYGSDERTIGSIWLLVSLLFPVMLAVLLLADGFNTQKCNRLLKDGKLSQAEVIKTKKDSKGNYLWTLRFQTDQGQAIQGKRAAFVYDQEGKPTTPVTVVYSPTTPSCWDLSLKPNENAINMKQRNFSLWLTMTFGWTFVALGLLTIIWSVRKMRHVRPYRELVLEAFENRSQK